MESTKKILKIFWCHKKTSDSFFRDLKNRKRLMHYIEITKEEKISKQRKDIVEKAKGIRFICRYSIIHKLINIFYIIDPWKKSLEK